MRVLLVDDHEVIREGLRALLARHSDIEVVGEAADATTAIAAARALRPDVVLLDSVMPGLDSAEATRTIASELPEVRVVGLSMHSDRRYVQAMFAAGAVGYLLKSAGSDELVEAVRTVAAGQHYVSPEVACVVAQGLERATGSDPGLRFYGERPRESSPCPPPCVTGAPLADAATLSAREREVLKLIAEGATSKDVAARLRVAVATVESHRKQISAKLGLHSVAALTKYAIRSGLTSVD